MNPGENLWVVIFRGVPRAGKTTLAKALYSELEDGRRVTLIHYDNMFEMNIGKERDRLKPAIAIGMIESFLIEGVSLILDYSFVFTEDLTKTIHLIEKYTSRYRIYFLKPSFLTIIKRDRNFAVPKGTDVLRNFWLTIKNNNFPGCTAIDTDRLSVSESVDFILNDIRSNLLEKEELSVLEE